MPLYILMLKSSIIWCRQQISHRGKNLEDSWKHTWINSSLLTVTLLNFSQKYHCILMLYSVLHLNLFLFRVQNFTGYLYIWKISKFIFLDRKICIRSYFNKAMPPLNNQMYNFFTTLSHCFSVLQSCRLLLKDGN